MMKERYTSPEMKIMCFAPAEKLAANDILDFSDLWSVAGYDDNNSLGVNTSTHDIDVR